MRRAFDWVFRSRIDGQIVIVQRPNLSLGIFVVATVVRVFLDAGSQAAAGARGIATFALVWWAADELARGVNPWRRALGAIVLSVQILALLRW